MAATGEGVSIALASLLLLLPILYAGGCGGSDMGGGTGTCGGSCIGGGFGAGGGSGEGPGGFGTPTGFALLFYQ